MKKVKEMDVLSNCREKEGKKQIKRKGGQIEQERRDGEKPWRAIMKVRK